MGVTGDHSLLRGVVTDSFVKLDVLYWAVIHVIFHSHWFGPTQVEHCHFATYNATQQVEVVVSASDLKIRWHVKDESI